MSKFILLLCAFLFTSAFCAEDAAIKTGNDEKVTPNSVQESKNKLVDMINGAIKQINDKVQEVQEKTAESIKKLTDEVWKLAETLYEKIIASQKNVQSIIDAEAGNVNVTGCSKMGEAFSQASFKALAEMSRCVNDVTEEVDARIQNIVGIAKTVLKDLTSIKNEAEVCVKDVDGIKKAAMASYCMNKVGAKGTWAVTKKVPALLLDIEKLKLQITNLLPHLSVCMTAKGVQSIQKGSLEIVQKVKNCVVEQKNKKY